jgi:hypothetical protein
VVNETEAVCEKEASTATFSCNVYLLSYDAWCIEPL